VQAYEWANDDPYRAVTHNKGVMNGIDALAVATGQDWRAIEAAAHAHASLRDGVYRPLTKYAIKNIAGLDYMVGELELPLSVATRGGSLKTNPTYQAALEILQFPNSQKLSQAIRMERLIFF
jgi:hydroxymethylglutaryl-CoA reductase